MSIGFLVFVMIFGVLAGAALLFAYTVAPKYERPPLGLVLAFLIPGIVTLAWITVSCQQSWRIACEKELVVQELDGIQFIQWRKDNGELITLNLNEKFKRSFRSDTKFKLQVFESGNYAGINYGYSWKIDTPQ